MIMNKKDGVFFVQKKSPSPFQGYPLRAGRKTWRGRERKGEAGGWRICCRKTTT